MARRPRKSDRLPSKEQILEFIRESPGRVGKREIARAFQVKGAERRALNEIMKELTDAGLIEGRRRRGALAKTRLPRVTVVEIVDTDIDGELIARPTTWHGSGPAPRIVMAPERRGAPALGVGDRVLSRLNPIGESEYEARTIKRLPAALSEVLGLYTVIAGGGRIVPTDKRQRQEFVVARGDEKGAEPGELVLAEILPARELGLRRARVSECLGTIESARSLSLIAIHSHAIPTAFTEAALAEAEAARPADLGKRTDLRDLPLITIDPEDARDHDDAVWAEPDGDADNEGGWLAIVAIADVGAYVRSGSALDECARERGNSVYLPDRVVPMLPEALSNSLCSLGPGVDRPVLAVRMWFDAEGKKLRHEFSRALMRSAAALTYRQVQAAIEGKADEATRPLLDAVIGPLYGIRGALRTAREARQPLDIEMPERRIVFGADGDIEAIRTRERLDSHSLVEELMIAANVSAAETLARLRRPCMYRVHEPPQEEKLEALRDFLNSLGYRLAKGGASRPAHFNRVIALAADTPHARLVNDLVLRAQSHALYSPDNLGHFGLALKRYAHFTSPIRRYADVLVHRALIAALGLGAGGLPEGAAQTFDEVGEHISATERRAQAAERDALDRFTAAFLAERVGADFRGHISGVTRFGLFVTLAESGADGLVPISTLGDDYYDHDEARHSLIGRKSRRAYRLGDEVDVRLAEADPITGGLKLELLEDRGAGRAPAETGKRRVPPRKGARRGGKRARRR